MRAQELDDSIGRSQKASVAILDNAFVLLCAVAMACFALVLLIPGTTESGHLMDEGAVLAYSDQMLEGAVPHRDFLTFYGPGNLWVVAGAFEVFGVSITTERSVGVFYGILIVLSVFVLARHLAGNGAAVAAGGVSALIMNGELVWASAAYGALAFALLGLALATSAAASPPGRRRQLLLLGAGAAGGVGVLMRFDFAPAIVLSAVPLVLFVSSKSRLWYAAGFAGFAGLYVPHLVLVGPDKVERVARDLIASAPGRTLPVPRPWEYPGTLLAAAVLVTGLFVVVGAVVSRRRPADLAGRILLAGGLMGAGLFPYALSRVEAIHIEPAAIVPLSLLPAFALWAAQSRHVRPSARIAMTFVLLAATAWMVTSEVGIRLDRRHPPMVENSNRTFYDLDRVRAESVDAVVTRLETDSHAGESLFVGPQDLRRTNYGPTYVYFLLPKLEPASYYMEMNPQTANREDSGLADELRAADWLVLTSEWDDWDEPNESYRLGSAEPNEVVRDRFCLRLESGLYRLYERCDRGGAA